MKSLHQFRLMILAMMRSLIPLVWVVFFLVLIIFIFAVIFVTGVISYLDDAPLDDTTAETLRVFFPSVSMAVMTLFMSVTGGVNWWEMEETFLEVSWIYGVLLVVFICVMIIAALNTVTATFVTDAIELAGMDKEISAHANLQHRRTMVPAVPSLGL